MSGQIIPLGTADPAQQYRVGLLGCLERILGQRLAGCIDCRAAYKTFTNIQRTPSLLGCQLHDLRCRCDDLLPNAIARQQ